ncbi:MAG: hypothetical protein K6E59_03080 [Bacilli bacterium]|nr:hypothetical protein [Bacilli bacterium]
MNKRWFLLSCLTVVLTSCVDTQQLYPLGAYMGGEYVEHVYDVWEGQTKQGFENIVYSKTLTNEEHGYFCGSGKHETAYQCCGYDQAKAWHPSYFKNAQGRDLYWGTERGLSDINPGAPGAYVDNSGLYDIIYSQNKRLDRYYENFSRGYLSKLYNGQIKCNGWSYYAMAVVSDQGFGTVFPYELKTAEYFATSLLVSTDYTPSGQGRIVVADIDFTFYKYAADGLEGYKVTLADVYLSCNAGAALTSLVGFTFDDVGISPEAIMGLSLTWRLKQDEVGATNDFSDTEKHHDGLSIYEVLFPDSTWY